MVLFAFGRTFWIAAVAALAATSLTGTALTSALGGSQASQTSTSAQAITGGYTVTNIAYNLNVTRPARVDSITFTIVAPGHNPSIVRVQPVTGGTFYTCNTAPSGPDYNATCATTSPQWTLVTNLTNMTALTIVIRQ